MKKLALIFVSFWITSTAAAACDNYLQFIQTDTRKAALYKKDCDIQSRYAEVQKYFNSIGINVNELAEYRLLRFIDRISYDTAAKAETPPSKIYNPAPMTWNVWDSGIRALFGNDDLSFILFKSGGFDSRGLGYDYMNFSNFNTLLLKNQHGDVSRGHLAGVKDRDSTPGNYRQKGDSGVGWTSYDAGSKGIVDAAQESMRRTQAAWEAAMGASFSVFVKSYNGYTPEQATFSVSMTVTPGDGGKYFVAFAKSDMVLAQITWLGSFIKATLERYRTGKSVMPPIEFSALVQKWLVTIHPFSDGNGRTSRAVQDMILANFKMPYAPGGDLQNDVLEDADRYVDQTYYAIESMLRKLEACAEEYRQKKEKPSYGCRTVRSMEIN